MNKHDSERIAGLLQQHGMEPVDEVGAADAVIFMTCCVREKADVRLFGQVSSLKTLKKRNRGLPIIAVGGCIGQRDGEKLIEQIPHIDVVFGTHNISSLPELIERAYNESITQVEILDDSVDEFSADLPSVPESSFHAWLPITTGCNNYCTYCVVPYVRGKEKSRMLETIVDDAKQMVDAGVKEITLLGQNVNSYGRDLYGEPRFADLLDKIALGGISRLGFATSHPKDLNDDTIAMMARHDNILDYLHLPVQSGSTAILEAMNRRYSKEQYLELIDRVREVMPGIALSTDIIVGFPGESEDDFEDTLEVVRAAQFSSAFTFIYSPREGTPAATLEGQVPDAVSQRRFERLVDEVQAQALEFSRSLRGTKASVLFEGISKRDENVLVGRDRHNKVVHVVLPEHTSAEQWEGFETEVAITGAHTWYITGELSQTDPEEN
ncbi:MAG: tRNA (N6-isopentenyl adenosine(37)-C2)-methylthiotransferase MiaB [Coriobacteriia bacterium]|nr:tRNA (N6-isopentenyl adenosine(37)-C2)-methylthiotransferase MiaB [Coriobacteriia bacterium]